MAELEVAQADVTTLDVDAIANAANTQLRHGGGGFPLEEAARIMVGAAREHEGRLERIVFAVHGEEAGRAFRAAL